MYLVFTHLGNTKMLGPLGFSGLRARQLRSVFSIRGNKLSSGILASSRLLYYGKYKMPAVNIDKITYDGPYMVVRANGKRYRVRTEQVSARLARAEPKQRESIRFSPEGFTVRWPLLDMEMSVASLMQMAQLTW